MVLWKSGVEWRDPLLPLGYHHSLTLNDEPPELSLYHSAINQIQCK